MTVNVLNPAPAEAIRIEDVSWPIDLEEEIPQLEPDALVALSGLLEAARYVYVSSFRAVANNRAANSSALPTTVRAIVRTIFQGYIGIDDRLSALIDQGLFATPNFDINQETGAVVQVPGIRLYTVADATAEA